MTNTRERLQALQAEAGTQHIRFENRKQHRAAKSKAINGTIALMALATAGASAAGMPAAASALATALLIAVALNLALTDTQHDRDQRLLSDAWRRHRTDATRLLAQDTIEHSANTAQRIEQETVELECRIAGTRATAD